jgi:hypothetical protein
MFGQGIASANPCEQIGIGFGIRPRPTYAGWNLEADYK